MRKKQNIKLPAVTRLASGSYHTRCMVDGKRIPITADTEKEVIARYLALKNGVIEAKKNKRSDRKTLQQAVAEYIESRRGYRSPSTIYGYEQNARNTFQHAMHYDVFTTTDEQWQQAIRAEKQLGRSPKYIQNAWSLMAASIEAATGRRPKVLLYQKEPKQRLYLEPDQIDIFVEAIKGTDIEIPALLCLSSLRRSEMLALTWDKVDLKKRIIHVHGAQVRAAGGMVEKPQNKSNKSRRTIPIIPPLYDALVSADRTYAHVVTMTESTIFRHLKAICEANGLPPICLHGLRHSFASLAYHLQIPEMIAAEIGGWNDLSTMRNIYTHLSQSDIAKRAQDFSDYFDQNKRKLATELATENKTP